MPDIRRDSGDSAAVTANKPVTPILSIGSALTPFFPKQNRGCFANKIEDGCLVVNNENTIEHL